MERSYQQQIYQRNQSSAEVDALRLLWGGTMKQFTPEARRFETWLRLIGYVETTRNINDVHRQFIRREGHDASRRIDRVYGSPCHPDAAVTAKGRNLPISILSRNHLNTTQGSPSSGLPSTTQEIPYGRTANSSTRRSTEGQSSLQATPSRRPTQRRRSANSKSPTSYVKKDILDALKSKECSPGTNSRLAYLKALQQLEIEYVEQITKMGVLPKNVASQTTTEYIFKAHVGKGGSVQTTPVNKQQLHGIERAEEKECKRAWPTHPKMKRSVHSSRPSTATELCRMRRKR